MQPSFRAAAKQPWASSQYPEFARFLSERAPHDRIARLSTAPWGMAITRDGPMSGSDTNPKLDPREEHFHLDGPWTGMSLFLRFLPSTNTSPGGRRVVLYVHGATFPSALSIAHRFDGRSWRDALIEAGFDVWGLDFHGFGHSDRYPEMSQPAKDNPPLCVAEDAATQIE